MEADFSAFSALGAGGRSIAAKIAGSPTGIFQIQTRLGTRETSSQNVNELSEKAKVGEPLVAQYRIYKENKLLLFSLKV